MSLKTVLLIVVSIPLFVIGAILVLGVYNSQVNIAGGLVQFTDLVSINFTNVSNHTFIQHSIYLDYPVHLFIIGTLCMILPPLAILLSLPKLIPDDYDDDIDNDNI
jgi:hypothetical protein